MYCTSNCVYTTSGIIVRFLPVENDKRRAALHGHHSEVGGGDAGRTGHVLIPTLLVREESEGRGDGARLIRLFVRLVYHVRSCRQEQETDLKSTDPTRLTPTMEREQPRDGVLPTKRFLPMKSTSDAGMGLNMDEFSFMSKRLAEKKTGDRSSG